MSEPPYDDTCTNGCSSKKRCTVVGHHRGRDRIDAAAESLAGDDHVGLHAVVLVCHTRPVRPRPVCTSSSTSSRRVAAQLLHAGEIAVARHRDPERRRDRLQQDGRGVVADRGVHRGRGRPTARARSRGGRGRTARGTPRRRPSRRDRCARGTRRAPTRSCRRPVAAYAALIAHLDGLGARWREHDAGEAVAGRGGEPAAELGLPARHEVVVADVDARRARRRVRRATRGLRCPRLNTPPLQWQLKKRRSSKASQKNTPSRRPSTMSMPSCCERLDLAPRHVRGERGATSRPGWRTVVRGRPSGCRA